MMRRFLCPSTLLAALMVVLAPTTTQAQITAPGPYYAVPSWDQTFPAVTRFVILSNMNSEAVLDRETGLVWERTPGGGETDFLGARISCFLRSSGGRKGWRLPSVDELTTLLLPTPFNPTFTPALPPGHPFDLSNIALGASVWSSTADPSAVYAVGLAQGNLLVAPPPPSQTQSHRWCVRGPGGR
jgi:hypothetical protein